MHVQFRLHKCRPYVQCIGLYMYIVQCNIQCSLCTNGRHTCIHPYIGLSAWVCMHLCTTRKCLYMQTFMYRACIYRSCFIEISIRIYVDLEYTSKTYSKCTCTSTTMYTA